MSSSPESQSYDDYSPLVVDDENHSDHDSTYEGSIESETTSVTSSIYKYRVENGRRYHAFKDGAYYAPNDEAAQDTLDIAHHSYLLLFGQKLCLAPIERPQTSEPEQVRYCAIPSFHDPISIRRHRKAILPTLISNPPSPTSKLTLDTGTKTGIWAIDFAEDHPQAAIIGTDLSPTMPSWVPPNVTFTIDDCNEYPWSFKPNSMDFIHARDLFGCINDWPEFLAQCYRTTKPGGYVELSTRAVWLACDDGSIPDDPDHVYNIWDRTFREVGERTGKTTTIIEKQRELMEKAGFEDVVEVKLKMPLGPWAKDKMLKEVGKFYYLECLQGLEGWALAFLTRTLGWDVVEVQVLLAKFRAAMKDRSLHVYVPYNTVYGRKPA
ncbi:hypothetical protein FQN51_004595 [Onygenales sp. PD_10]|nr:hypothetical protein FQN51_004595 [Onygenales sp. PD_10]